MLPLEEEILINQWVQKVTSTSKLTDWYDEVADPKKRELLVHLVSHCRQARASDSEGLEAVFASGLNPRRSASVLLSKGAGVEILNKISSLKSADGKDAFVLLLNLLRIADGRRQAGEAPGSCHHWWHRDLGDEAVLEIIRREHASGKLGYS